MRAQQHQLIDVLAGHDVSFVPLGGAAMQAHGIARVTKDVDVLIAPDEVGAELGRALEALRAEVVLVVCASAENTSVALSRVTIRWGV